MGLPWSVLFTYNCADDKIAKNEMGGACSSDGRGVYRGLVGKPEERDHWGDPDVDGRIIRWILKKMGCGVMDRIELAQDRETDGG
jgi:hypothetical protein